MEWEICACRGARDTELSETATKVLMGLIDVGLDRSCTLSAALLQQNARTLESVLDSTFGSLWSAVTCPPAGAPINGTGVAGKKKA